jgi:hypothetical protein
MLGVQVMVGVGLTVNVGKFNGVEVKVSAAVGPSRVSVGAMRVAVGGKGVF